MHLPDPDREDYTLCGRSRFRLRINGLHGASLSDNPCPMCELAVTERQKLAAWNAAAGAG